MERADEPDSALHPSDGSLAAKPGAASGDAGAAPVLLRGAASWRWYAHYLRDPLGCLIAAEKQFGPLVVFGNPLPLWRGGRRFVVAIGAPYNRAVLGQPDVFRPGGQVLSGPKGSAQRRLRDGIFSMSGGKHRRHRRIMQPPFLKPAVAGYAPVMARLIDQVIDSWRDGEERDLYRDMRTLSNWVAAYLLFGNHDFDASIRVGKEIEAWLLLDAEARAGLFGFQVLGGAYRRLLRQGERLEGIMREAVARNREANAGDDALSVLVRAFDAGEGRMREQDLIAHAVILYAASFETTANVLAWTLFLVAQHPSVATALLREINEKLTGWPPDAEAIDRLPMLNAVTQEALRLLPPVPYTFRTADEETVLGPLKLRRGDKVILSHYLTHRDPAVFPQPNRFDPARWFAARPDPYAFIPFSAGPRLCLGYSFALLELKMTVARVVQRYRLQVRPGAAIDGTIQLTLRPRGGIPVTVHAQDGAFAAGRVFGNIHGMVHLPA